MIRNIIKRKIGQIFKFILNLRKIVFSNKSNKSELSTKNALLPSNQLIKPLHKEEPRNQKRKKKSPMPWQELVKQLKNPLNLKYSSEKENLIVRLFQKRREIIKLPIEIMRNNYQDYLDQLQLRKLRKLGMEIKKVSWHREIGEVTPGHDEVIKTVVKTIEIFLRFTRKVHLEPAHVLRDFNLLLQRYGMIYGVHTIYARYDKHRPLTRFKFTYYQRIVEWIKKYEVEKLRKQAEEENFEGGKTIDTIIIEDPISKKTEFIGLEIIDENIDPDSFYDL